MLGDLNQFGFVLYSDIKTSEISNERVICQVDSMTRLSLDKFKYVIIDECESTARYLTSKHFTKNPKSSLVVSILEQRIYEAKQVIIMDADLSNRCVEYYKQVMRIDDCRLIINTFKPYQDYTIVTMSYDDWVQNIVELVGRDKKLAIPMASNNKAKDLKTKLEQDFPDLKLQLIHKETKDEDKIAGLMKVNETWTEFDVVIYTPSVCMGVSFDVPDYFEHICAYGCENSLGAQEFAQMMHRVRSPKSKKIFLSLNIYKPFDDVEDVMTFEQTEKILCSDYYLTHYDLHQTLVKVSFDRNEKDERILVYPYKNDPNYRLFVHNALENITNTLNFGATLFGYLKGKEYQFECFSYDVANRDFGIKASMKSIRNQRETGETEVAVQAILDADDITRDEYHELIKTKDEYLAEDDINKINRFKLRDTYDVPDIDLQFDFVEEFNDKDKMKWYKNSVAVMATETQSTIEKLYIMKNNITKDKHLNTCYMDLTAKCEYQGHYYCTNIIQACGFDINDQDRLINQQELEKTVKDSIGFIESNKHNIAHKFNLKLYNKEIVNKEFKDQVKIINGIINGYYGMKLKRVSPYKKNMLPQDIYYKLDDCKNWDNLPREKPLKPVDLKQNDGNMYDPLSKERILHYLLNDGDDEDEYIPV